MIKTTAIWPTAYVSYITKVISYVIYIIYISLLSKLFLFPQLQLLREGIRLVTFLPRLTVGGEVPVPERSHETRRGIRHSESLKKQRPLQGPIYWRYHIHDIYIMYIYNVYIYIWLAV